MDATLTEAERAAKGLGKGRGLAEQAAARAINAPDPSARFSHFWTQDDTATWGYASTTEHKQDQAAGNLPYQRGAPGGAAGPASSTEYVGPAGPGGPPDPYPRELIENCLH